MGKLKGLIGAATLALFGCGNDSGSVTEYDYEFVTDSTTSVVPGVSSEAVIPYSSAEIIPGNPIESLLSSSSQAFYNSCSSLLLVDSLWPSRSSSSIAFDSAYFGGVQPVSSAMEHGDGRDPSEDRNPVDDREPSDGREPGDVRDPHSSNSEPPRSSSSMTPAHAQYSKILGADISQMQEYEAKGVRVLDTDGSPKDVFELFRDHGFNYIRLKTFVGPSSKYGYAASGCDQGTGTFGTNVEAFGDKEHVVAYAKRAKAAGLKLLLDFHYSDNWADPGKQIIPERWRNVKTSDAMADSVFAYTLDVLQSLQAENALPEMVQVGNEITNGMLREVPTGSTNCWGENVQTADAAVSGIMSNATGVANTAKYLAAGSRAVKEISNNIKTVFHIESPHKTSTVEWWMKSIIQNSKVTPDVMAFSAYTAYEHGNPDTWKTLMTNLGKTYTNLEFLIAEYNGAQTKDNYSFDGSRAKTLQIMEQVPRGIGAFIWEPERSGAWGTSMFDWEGGNLKANKKAFDEYEVLF